MSHFSSSNPAPAAGRRLALVLSGLLAAAGIAAAPAMQPNTLTPQEIADGWVLLFDGETTFGWQARGAAQWQVSEGTVTASSGGAGMLSATASLHPCLFASAGLTRPSVL